MGMLGFNLGRAVVELTFLLPLGSIIRTQVTAMVNTKADHLEPMRIPI